VGLWSESELILGPVASSSPGTEVSTSGTL